MNEIYVVIKSKLFTESNIDDIHTIRVCSSLDRLEELALSDTQSWKECYVEKVLIDRG